MKQKFFLSFLLLMVLSFAISPQSYAQLSISGPTCVSEGSTYLYNIRAKWDSSGIAKVCVSGGVLAEQGGTCASSAAFSYVKVIWDNDSQKGLITITFGSSQSSLAVNISKTLNGGMVDSASKTQILDTLTQPSVINCSLATGGNCFPEYSYQWQDSDNGTKWTDIKAATGQRLALKTVLKTTMFYRRRVIEFGSGSVGYSDIATVIININ